MTEKVIWEYPGDWKMQEGPLAKRFSDLGYRLLTMADAVATDNRPLSVGQKYYLDSIDILVRDLPRK